MTATRLRLAVVLWALCGMPLAAQQIVAPAGELDAYVRLLELQGHIAGAPIVFHSPSAARSLRDIRDSSELWRTLLAPDTAPGMPAVLPLDANMTAFYSSDYPRVANDGAVWAGKGLTVAASAGAELCWGPVTATLYPTVYHAQNRPFPLDSVPWPNRSRYAYQWWPSIDWPQRMGPDAFTKFDWGQSGIRLDWHAVTVGFSVENMWWGPGYRNAIIMSDAGPGFPHVDLGTGYPVRTPIGDIELRAVWGALSESQYFDTIPQDGRRYFTGLVLGYRPRFLPGLNLGLNRVRYERWPAGGLGFGDLLLPFSRLFESGTVLASGRVAGSDSTDQLLSVTARWLLPASHFEVYAEWARNDFSESLTDFVVEPEHSRAYTIGVQQAIPAGNVWWRLAAETTTLGQDRTLDLRSDGSYYLHSKAIGGYTQQGQLIGAAIGPGANSQYLGVDRYTPSGRLGIFVQRIRFDDDAYYKLFAGTQQFHAHEVELTAGVSAYRLSGPVAVGLDVQLSRELNRYFQLGNNITNLWAKFSMTWLGGSEKGKEDR